MSRIDIALLHPCFWPEVQRGAERLIRDLATDLVAAGHRPRLITSHPAAPRRTVEQGLVVERHWRPPSAFLAHRGYQEHLTHLPFSYLSLMRGDDDIAHAHFPTDALVARRWGARAGRPSVFTYHGNPERAVLASRRGRVRVLAEAIGGCDPVVTSSRAAADGLRRWFGVDARVIYPGVRLEEFTGEGTRDERPTIACAAAPDDARKRMTMLLGAFRRVRAERPDARLLLVRPADSRVATQLLDPGVELVDPGPAAPVTMFRRAWVSALASRNEAFGLVLIEALACGVPVVGPDDGGVPEIVDRPEVGRLFNGTEGDLARALLETLELAGLPGTAAACSERAGAFTTERTSREHVALYRELMEKGPASRLRAP